MYPDPSRMESTCLPQRYWHGFRDVRRGPSPTGILVSVNHLSMYLCQASYTDLRTSPPISPVSKPYVVLIVGLAQGGWGNSQIWHGIGSYSCKLKVHKCGC